MKINTLLARPHINIKDLRAIKSLDKYLKTNLLDTNQIEKVEIEIKYGGYLNKEKKSVEKFEKFEKMKLSAEFEYDKLHSISTEGREKLNTIKPKTIGQASRISGVSPSDINILLIYLGK